MFKVGLLEFYDTFMSPAKRSKTMTDVNLILGGLDNAMSGMESIFLNGVYPLGDFSQNSAYEETMFTYGGTDAFDSCNLHELTPCPEVRQLYGTKHTNSLLLFKCYEHFVGLNVLPNLQDIHVLYLST